jgi:O-6-methylguanine DNA methyltransferase
MAAAQSTSSGLETEYSGLPGVGPWTSEFLAMRALRSPDAFPGGDLGMRKALGGLTERQVRAVGAANGRNPLAIIIPCHRVIGRSGDLVGYAGGLDAKSWLLAHEKTVA